MWWILVTICLGIWAIKDAKARKEESQLLPRLTFVFGTLVLPIYLAKRNLKEGEVREGGMAWNVLKNFALYWTITCIVWVIYALCTVGSMNPADEYEAAGAAIGTGIGIMMIGGLWFIGTVGAVILGVFLKKSSIVENGPTGALAISASDSID